MGYPHSPQGRVIENLQGEAADIRARGTEISELGGQMISSADTLERIAADAAGMKGEAAEKLQEIVGESFKDLRKAGNMYKPFGPVLISYADAVEDCKPRIAHQVTECERTHLAYASAPGYANGDRPSWDRTQGDDEEQVSRREAEDDEDAQKQSLWTDHAAALAAFDREVDTWEAAFDAAVEGIDGAFDEGIKDGFWDNVDGFVSGLLTVLQFAGMFLAVAAILIGGPIIAALAAVVAVATLVLTTYQMIRGDAGWGEMALAIVGVIPFGSAGKLFQGKAGWAAVAGDAFPAFRPSTWSRATNQLGLIRSASYSAGGGARGFVAGAREFASEAGIANTVTRLMFGKTTKDLVEMSEIAAGVTTSTTLGSGGAAWQLMHTTIAGPIKMSDLFMKFAGQGENSVTKKLPWLGALT